MHEVLTAIALAIGAQPDDVERMAARKAAERGAFAARIWLESW